MKRKRSDSETASDLIVHSDLWFDDGNLLVQAQGTQFRVFRGTLVYHAPGIKALLDSEDPEQIAGTPVLVLSDSSEDLEYVFRTLFYLDYPDSEPIPMAVVTAFARIGRKYGMDKLLRSAITRLTAAFPSTLEGWLDTAPANAAILCDADKSVRNEIAGATLLLARELNIPRLLPPIFFYFSHPEKFSLLVSEQPVAIAEADRKTILNGYKARLQAQRELLHKWLEPEEEDNPSCVASENCELERLKASMTIWLPGEAGSRFGWRARWAEGLCAPCRKAAKISHELGAKRMWDAIPGMFDLAPWKELLAEDSSS
ncbi:hypothetical protein C8F01DRAFT_1169206 [Mycena amicta]|nr:hypothetical protein C8F01DRAFT_1169206 [Mycena amicta]